MSSVTAQDRCVAHPGRPAVDHCPRCGRPRCAADAAGPGCAVCTRTTQRPAKPVPPDLERLVRAALVANGVALVAGPIASEYVGAPILKFLAPAVIGVAVVMAATAAAQHPRGALLLRVRLIGVAYAVLAVAIGFAADGTYGVISWHVDVLVPYLFAAAGAWLMSSPPRQRAVRASEAD